MKRETTTTSSSKERGFRISEQPVVGVSPNESSAPAQTASPLGDLPTSYGGDLLYVIARDPNSLFLYWDLDWPRLFDESGLTTQPVHLRILRDDETEEATIAIEPEVGYCFADVAAAGARYSCELGCFDGSNWKALARSASTETPAAALSDDLSADFATLPLHLAFQRLLQIFRTTQSARETLVSSIAEMQKKARVLQPSIAEANWPLLIEAAAAENGLEPGDASDLANLLQADRKNTSQQKSFTPEMLQRWKEFGEKFAETSWGQSSFGGSSSSR